MLLLARLSASRLSRNILAVASGTAAGQVITFAFSPLITRIYSPETFGVQGVFLSLVSILSPVIALRFPMGIILADDDEEAARLGWLAMCTSFAISILLGVVLLVGREPVLTLLGSESLGPLILFLPLALLCVAAQDVANFRAAREGRFRQVGIVNVVQAFVTSLARVLGGLAAPVAAVLVAVTSIAPGIQAALLRLGEGRQRSRGASLYRRQILELVKKYRDFPIYRVPTDVLNSASQSVPVIMLAALFSPAAAGLYTLTRSVLTLPANFIGVAIGNVLYAHYAECNRAAQPLLPILVRWTAGLATLAPIIVGLAWFAPAAFAFLFGEEWREAGYYARWMSIWVAVGMANAPAVRLAPVIKAQMLLLVANGLMLVGRIIAIVFAFWSEGDALMAVAIFSVFGSVANGLLIVVIMLATSRYDRALRGRNT